MKTIEKLQEMLDIQIIENYNGHCYDLEIGEYYEPSVDVILDRITELPKGSTVWISDIEAYLPDYEVEDWINNNADIETPEQVY